MEVEQLTLNEKKWVNTEIKEEIKKLFLELNENENTTSPNPWDTIKGGGKFTALKDYIKKQELSPQPHSSIPGGSEQQEEITFKMGR